MLRHSVATPVNMHTGYDGGRMLRGRDLVTF